MKTIHWIVEDFHAELGYQALVKEICKQGHLLRLFTLKDAYSEDTQCFPEGECVLFQGSLSMAQTLLSRGWWKPTAWLNIPSYDCSAYYPAFQHYLFNDKYCILRKSDFEKKIDDIWKEFGRDDHIFLRPNSGLKSFGGSLFTKEEYISSTKWINNFTTNDTLLVVSTPKSIQREWRCVVDDKSVLAQSLYKMNGRIQIASGTYEHVVQFANKVLFDVNYRPDPMWCMDIAEDADGNLWVLEIGSFSCSGLYACNPEPIVKRASQLALIANEEYEQWIDECSDCEGHGKTRDGFGRTCGTCEGTGLRKRK